MKTQAELERTRDEAKAELAEVDAAIARAVESRELAGTVPGGTGDANLKKMRERRSTLSTRIADVTRSLK
ncbi:MAG: hypothetical protein R3C08_13010 [Hyphomonas sp.]